MNYNSISKESIQDIDKSNDMVDNPQVNFPNHILYKNINFSNWKCIGNTIDSLEFQVTVQE